VESPEITSISGPHFNSPTVAVERLSSTMAQTPREPKTLAVWFDVARSTSDEYPIQPPKKRKRKISRCLSAGRIAMLMFQHPAN